MRWYLNIEGQNSGPYDDATVVQMIHSGQLVAAWICQEGGSDWVALGAHPPFAAALHAVQNAAQPAAAQPTEAQPAAAQPTEAQPAAAQPAAVTPPATDQAGHQWGPATQMQPQAGVQPQAGAQPQVGVQPVVQQGGPPVPPPGAEGAPPVPPPGAEGAPPVPPPGAEGPAAAADGIDPADRVKDSVGRLFGRIPKLFTSPSDYWRSVAKLRGGIFELLLPTVLILVGASALFSLLGSLIAMRGLLGLAPGSMIAGLLITAVLSVVASAGVWLLMAVLINAFAGPFGARKDGDAARRLAFGALTPMWLAGVFGLIPIRWLALILIFAAFGYGCFLLVVGLPKLNGTPKGKAIGYTAAVMGIMVVISFVFSLLAACPTGCAAACAVKSRLGDSSKLRDALRKLGSGSRGSSGPAASSYDKRIRARLSRDYKAGHKGGYVSVKSGSMGRTRLRYDDAMKLALKLRGSKGTVVKIAGQSATIGDNDTMVVDVQPFFDKAAKSLQLSSPRAGGKRRVKFKIEIPVKLAKGDESKTDTLRIDGGDTLKHFFSILKSGRGATFGQEPPRPDDQPPRSVLVDLAGGLYFIGKPGPLSSVDLVATRKYKTRSRRCRYRYRSRRTGRVMRLYKELNHKVVTVYDRRTGKKVAKKTFYARGRCPRRTTNKKPSFYAKDSKIVRWLHKKVTP